MLFKEISVVRAEKGITLVSSNEDLDEIIRKIESLENLGLLIDGVRKTLKNEIKKQEGRFLGMLSGTLKASVLGNMLTGKGVMRAGKGIISLGTGPNINHMGHNF